jgi:hypothetical protein
MGCPSLRPWGGGVGGERLQGAEPFEGAVASACMHGGLDAIQGGHGQDDRMADFREQRGCRGRPGRCRLLDRPGPVQDVVDHALQDA